jgi:hypothetical protein
MVINKMRILKFDTKELANQLGCNPELLYSEVCIIDNEISNDLSILSWDYTKSDIIITGTLYHDLISIFVREKEDNITKFKQELTQFLNNVNKPLYAFNQDMEHGNFRGFLDLRLPVAEIQPFKKKYWTKDKFFNTLIEQNRISPINLKDNLNGDGKKCIEWWATYIKTNHYKYLTDIIMHNINCLIKECIIQKNKKYFSDNYIIDEGHFMLREKTEEEKKRND